MIVPGPDLKYCTECQNCTKCVDCNECEYCNLCFDCAECGECKQCISCNMCYLCTDCEDCAMCYDCTNLQGKFFHIRNIDYKTIENYKAELEKIKKASYKLAIKTKRIIYG